MSTQFNFPANPNPGDIFILPGGGSAQWDGTEWTSLSDSSVVYPLPITQGGTGASTAAGARTNLGINTATGEFVVTKDGTAVAPGLAWASEPGLGFYRIGAGLLGVAALGATVAYVLGQAASSTLSVNSPVASGTAQINIANANYNATNYNIMALQSNPTGYNIAEFLGGTATAKPLKIGPFPQGVSILSALTVAPATGGASVYVNKAQTTGSDMGLWGQTNGKLRWFVDVGDSINEAGSNAGSNFGIYRYADDGSYLGLALTINRASGGLTIPSGWLAFPATQNSSADPNTLDDYKEGTWTPAFAGVGITTNVATYTKIGRKVYIQFQGSFPSSSSGTNIQITGLPYACTAAAPLAIGYHTAAWAGNTFTAMASGSAVSIYMGAGFATSTQFSGAQIYFGGSYQTA